MQNTIEQELEFPEVLPVLPVRGLTIYPYVIMPIFVTQETAIAAVDSALSKERQILVLGQRDQNDEMPDAEGLHEIGTIATLMRQIKMPDGRLRVLLQGLCRCRVEYFTREEPYREAKIQVLSDTDFDRDQVQEEALRRNAKTLLERAASLGKTLSSEILVIAGSMEDTSRLADLLASNIEIKPQDGQRVLEALNPYERLKHVYEILTHEVALLEMQQQINTQARGEMDRSQRDFYLRQQLKIIQTELGEGNEIADEIENYRKKIAKLDMPDEAVEEIEKHLRRLEHMSPDTAETGLIRTYLDWMTELPWGLITEDLLDLVRVKRVLDREHYGLEEIKERLLEFLAVRKLNPQLKSPILCFVGPPGVGKTSLGQSIAKAMGRKFHRLSLGGLRDEAEIRGHRKTYVGAMPGRIIQGLSHAGAMNPIIMMDEVDKIGQDFRGDPQAALLEVLDPEQNSSFRDHYLGVPFDLSQVLFILTANTLDTLQPAFRDRLEIIEIGSYTLDEKRHIATRHLVPKQIREHGLDRKQISISSGVIKKIISSYTREAGLRLMERLIAKIARKVARKVAEGEEQQHKVTVSNLAKYLGPPKIFPDFRLQRDQVGVVAGLAWTSVGGEILFVEASIMDGKGNLDLTGQLGDVMKESAKLALSLIRTRSGQYGIDKEFFANKDVHIHFPEGATPKDGPSAGITVACALLSCFTQRRVRAEVAMTGELTLRGDVLPIGGLKEKILAAGRANLKDVIIPKLNESDLEDIPEELRENLNIHPVSDIDEVFQLALHSSE
jgi:ATP-dependent Lon protease